MQQASPALTFRHVGKTFQERAGDAAVEAIRDIDETVADGEFLVILGPSGCGKSTLLEIAAGLQSPTKGEVLLGEDVITRPHEAVGMVFQEDALFPWRTALENMAFGLEVKGVPAKRRREICRDILDLVGLREFADHYPRQLSGGMRQRVSIGRALASDPAVLLMDEPFGALDQQTRYYIGTELLRVWEATGKTIMFVTHDINEAVLLGDRVWLLSQRPAVMHLEVAVDIPRPRGLDTLADARFHELTSRLWQALAEESRKGLRDPARNAGLPS